MRKTLGYFFSSAPCITRKIVDALRTNTSRSSRQLGLNTCSFPLMPLFLMIKTVFYHFCLFSVDFLTFRCKYDAVLNCASLILTYFP